ARSAQTTKDDTAPCPAPAAPAAKARPCASSTSAASSHCAVHAAPPSARKTARPGAAPPPPPSPPELLFEAGHAASQQPLLDPTPSFLHTQSSRSCFMLLLLA